MFKSSPAVFAVGKNYQITVPVTCPSLFWVEVGGKKFYDERNGIMRTPLYAHKVYVPTQVLDLAEEYTICEKEIVEKKPYFTESKDTVRETYAFRPVPDDKIRIYNISDGHEMTDEPVGGAETFGDIDLLILNGDMGSVEDIYEVISRVTGGSIPVVFTRGNHDLREYHSDEFDEATPDNYGNSYFSFRVGGVWGLVLDCGEDKVDGDSQYADTICCHVFRQRQTDYIRSLIADSANEYGGEGVRHKLIFSHTPFTYIDEPPHNIELDIYSEWASLIRENIKPELMLCGHLHMAKICPAGADMDNLGQPCTMIIGSDKSAARKFHKGCGVELTSGEPITVTFCDNGGNKETYILPE